MTLQFRAGIQPLEIVRNDGPSRIITGGPGLRGLPGAGGTTGDAYESYGVSIYRAVGIATGGYYADRRANAASTQDTIYVEIIDADPGSEIDIYLEVAGSPAYGPFTVVFGVPVTATGLGLAVAEGNTVNWVVASIIGGAVRDVFAKSYGAVA